MLREPKARHDAPFQFKISFFWFFFSCASAYVCTYKPAHIRLWDLVWDWGVYWCTCKEGQLRTHRTHSQKKTKNSRMVPVYKSCASCKLATKSDLRGSTRHYPARTRSSSRNLTSASDRPHRHCARTFTLQLKKYKEVLACFFPILYFF